MPSDFENGTNFIIKKDKQGEYSSYSFSKFAKRETALDEDTVEYVKTQMKDLSTLLPAEPSLEEVEAWLEAEMTGGPAPVTGGRPGQQASQSDDSDAAEAVAALQARRAAQAAASRPAPVADDEDDAGDGDMDSVLAAIAARRRARDV